MVKFSLKECFVCEFCRQICQGPCDDDLARLEQNIIDDKNKDLVGGRKQRVKCLGKYCDRPCQLQDLNAEVNPQILINVINYLGQRLNNYLTSN